MWNFGVIVWDKKDWVGESEMSNTRKMKEWTLIYPANALIINTNKEFNGKVVN